MLKIKEFIQKILEPNYIKIYKQNFIKTIQNVSKIERIEYENTN